MRTANRLNTATAASRSPDGSDTARLRPGAVFPLRTMAQDELFSAAFSVIRRNPQAVLGLPFLAGLLNFITALLLMALFPSQAFMRMFVDPLAFEDPELAWAVMGDGGVWLLLMLAGFIGNLMLALALGLLAIPTLRAAYGLPTTLGQTIRLRIRTLGWLLLHLVIMIILLTVGGFIVLVASGLVLAFTFFIGGIVLLPGLFLLLCWVTAAVMFSPLVIVVERRNPLSALARSFSLNRGSWWRHIGAVALVYLIGGIALLIATLPAGIVMGIGSEIAWQSPQGQDDWLAILILGLGQLYDAVLAALLIALGGTLIGVMYLNARFRQEALDAVLLDAVGTTEDTATLLPGSPEHLSGYFSAPADRRPSRNV